MGWTSWDLEATTYPGVDPSGTGSWLTEQHVLQQADAMAAKLKQYGYDYVDIDAGWTDSFDSYGRPVANPATFPDGIAYIASHVHKEGLKLGIYIAVGLAPAAYNDGNTPIYGAPGCYTRDIVYPDLRLTNGWNDAYQIELREPVRAGVRRTRSPTSSRAGASTSSSWTASARDRSRAARTTTTRPDVAAWSQALKATGRPMQFMISWALSHDDASTWEQYTNGWRIDTDVDCYCSTLVTWDNSVKERWDDVVQWIPDAGPGTGTTSTRWMSATARWTA